MLDKEMGTRDCRARKERDHFHNRHRGYEFRKGSNSFGGSVRSSNRSRFQEPILQT